MSLNEISLIIQFGKGEELGRNNNKSKGLINHGPLKAENINQIIMKPKGNEVYERKRKG